MKFDTPWEATPEEHVRVNIPKIARPDERTTFLHQEEFDIKIPHQPDQVVGIPTDMAPKPDLLPYDQLYNLTWHEDRILKDGLKHTVLDGIRNHHPEIAKVIVQSFDEYPDLQMAYIRS